MRFSENRVLRFLLRVVAFALVMIIAGEMFFRLVIPAGITAFRIHDREFGVLLYDTTAMREGLYTAGRFAQYRAHWHINNYCWRSGWNYYPPSPGRKPVIALIGDSFIAGFHVDDKYHISTVLRDELGGRYDVYTFGEGGAPFSQYLWLAQYAARHFDPDVFVFLVGDGDWKPSITNYMRNPRVHQLTFKNGEFTDAPYTFNDTNGNQLAKYSAIIRYLTYNADYDPGKILDRRKAGAPEPVNPAGIRMEDEGLVDSSAAYFVNRLAREHPGKRIVFMVDGRHPAIYAGEPDVSQATAVRLEKVCDGSAFHVLNVGPILAARYNATHERFGFAHDQHWNALGHRIFGTALADFMIREHIVNTGEIATDSSITKHEDSH